MSDDVLKGCPFCGGEAKLVHDERGHQRPTWYAICPPCDLIRDQAYGCATAKEAADAWNTRTPSVPNEAREVVERLHVAAEVLGKSSSCQDEAASVRKAADLIERTLLTRHEGECDDE